MCKFFSLISDGKGNIKYFDIKDIVEQMAIGNIRNFSWNSHTSICQFHGINSKSEDLWNKWEYNPKTKALTPDSLPMGVGDDSEIIKPKLIGLFNGKNIDYMINIYNSNSGDSNSGHCNSGHCNSGNRNSGDCNSGDRNSGDWNSGHCNSGNRNSGNRNSGDCNSGDSNSGQYNSGKWNSGNGNSGHYNSGHCNSGNRNSGNGNSGYCNSGHCNSGNRNSGGSNSGHCNSGHRNSGDCNSGNGVLNSFCTENHYILFDKACSEKNFNKSLELSWSWFNLNLWVSSVDMSKDEKKSHPYWEATGGYLKTISYKEAWKKCPQDFIDKVKKLKGFTKKKFKEISGLDV